MCLKFDALSNIGQFHTHYIIFKNVEISKILFLPSQKIFVKDNSEYFKNIPFVEMENFKIN
jgi:hypothetical protein